MTKLSYVYTSKSGEIQVFTSYPQMMALISRQGGNYKAVYEPVIETTPYTGKRERIKL